MLTPTQMEHYQRDGYAVLPGFKTAAQIATLRARAEALVQAFEPGASREFFTTQEQLRTVNAYFLESANTVRCFFEEEAFAPDGSLRQAKHLSINKIGHAMHDLDPVFRAFSTGSALAQVAADLDVQQPQVWQSMYIFKQPGIGGEIAWHQDATFFASTPMTVTTFWFALEDATLDNGCLWVEPGGHRGPLRQRFERHSDTVTLRTLDATPWPDARTAIPLEVKAGTLVVFHGLLPHYSAANRSATSRHAYTLHVTDGRSAYAPTNWIQRSAELPARGLMHD
jgi:phytanoyl-CoA hydroxylase